jgi:hypothetical protein
LFEEFAAVGDFEVRVLPLRERGKNKRNFS